METTLVVEIFKVAGVIISAIVGAITLLKIVSGRYEKRLAQIIEETTKKQFEEVQKELEKIHEANKRSEETDVCLLRHDITSIYYDYREAAKIPDKKKSDLCSLYSNYTSRGGNSYIHSIYDEMMGWKTY